MSILLFAVILAVLILAHEFGHFIVAKAFGIRVDEFGLGFPPKLWGKKFGETEYTINAIPFGGFVRIFGENPSEDPSSQKGNGRSFAHKPKLVQSAVLLAGVTFNILLAWILLSAGLMAGMPASEDEASLRGVPLKDASLVITSTMKDSPAEKSGLKAGDRILGATSGNEILEDTKTESFQNFIAVHEKVPVVIQVKRGSESLSLTTTPEKGVIGETARIGISLDSVGTIRLPFFQAITAGGSLTYSYTKMTVLGIYELLKNAVIGKPDFSSVSGPVGIVGIVQDASTLGFAYLIMLTALISINLAVVNVLPIPALDGGRLFFILIEVVKGSPLKPRAVNLANMIGFAVLIGLIVVVTFHDIWKLLTG